MINMRNMRGVAATIVVIFLTAILIFGTTLLTTADKVDDATMLFAQSTVNDTVNKIRTKGTFTQEDYDNLVLTLSSTGYAWDIELTVNSSDENPAKKSTGTQGSNIGDTIYITKKTSQVLQELPMTLKAGDTIEIKATLKSESWTDFFTRNSADRIVEASGMIAK